MAKRTDSNAYVSERKVTRQPSWKLRIQEQARKDDVAELERAARKAWLARRAAEKTEQK